MSTFFEYALPVPPLHATSKPDGGKPNPDKGDKGDKSGDKGDGGKKDAPVHTQMKGEKPGDDLGYDPKIIPTEEI